MSIFWQFITDFGDSSVTLSLAAFVLIYLLLLARWRTAGAWAASVVGCAAAMALLKLSLRSCAQILATPMLTSPSGHAAMSATVYGGFALLLTPRPAPWQRVPALAAALVLAIALSRLAPQAHQPAEVLVGLAIGGAATLLFRRLRGKTVPPLPIFGLFAGALLLAAATHGARWPVEDSVDHLAQLIRLWIPACA